MIKCTEKTKLPYSYGFICLILLSYLVCNPLKSFIKGVGIVTELGLGLCNYKSGF